MLGIKRKVTRSAWDKKKSNMKKFIPNDRFFPGNSPLPEGILIHLKGTLILLSGVVSLLLVLMKGNPEIEACKFLEDT